MFCIIVCRVATAFILLYLGSGGVVYGFIGANSSLANRTKFMAYYRVTCMAGVLLSTIGEFILISHE